MANKLSGRDMIKLLSSFLNIPAQGVREVRIKAAYNDLAIVEIDMIGVQDKEIISVASKVDIDIKYKYIHKDLSISFDNKCFD